MAKTNIGKKWEDKFKLGWTLCFPKPRGWIFRLKDNMNRFKDTSGNPCDFLCHLDDYLFMVECKEHKGASIPFKAIPQYERLLEHEHYNHVSPGVLIWFSDKDTVIWVNIYEREKMVKDGEKSIGLRMLKEGKYKIVVLPCEVKRTYPVVDYNYLIQEEINYVK